MNTNSVKNSNFNIALNTQTLGAFSFSVSKLQETTFKSLVVNILAIDNDDAYIGRGEFLFSQNAANNGVFKEAKKEIFYSRNPISSNW